MEDVKQFCVSLSLVKRSGNTWFLETFLETRLHRISSTFRTNTEGFWIFHVFGDKEGQERCRHLSREGETEGDEGRTTGKRRMTGIYNQLWKVCPLWNFFSELFWIFFTIFSLLVYQVKMGESHGDSLSEDSHSDDGGRMCERSVTPLTSGHGKRIPFFLVVHFRGGQI